MLLRWLDVSRRARANDPVSIAGLPPDTRTPFQRLAASRPHLLPADDRLESFLRWMTDLGEDPSSEDALELYAAVCDLAGWSAPWPDLPVAPVPEVGNTQSIKGLVPVAPLPPTVGALHLALSGAEAAPLFLAWVRAEDRCGVYSSTELDALYTEHAAAIGTAETPHNMLRGELKRLPGVEAKMTDYGGNGKRPRGKNRAERRMRSTHYTLHPDPAANVTREPWRQAA